MIVTVEQPKKIRTESLPVRLIYRWRYKEQVGIQKGRKKKDCAKNNTGERRRRSAKNKFFVRGYSGESCTFLVENKITSLPRVMLNF